MTHRFAAGITLFLLATSPSFAVDLDRSDVKSFMKTMVKAGRR